MIKFSIHQKKVQNQTQNLTEIEETTNSTITVENF